MNKQIYILTEQNEVKESSSIYYGDDKGTPQPIKQVYRTDDDGKVVLAKCYHDDKYNITYDWNGYSSCTATATCPYNSTHTVSETKDSYSQGNYYVVDFDNPMFETQTKDKERNSYSISYTYNSDYITLSRYNPDYAYEDETVTIRFSSKTYYNTVTVSYDDDYFGDTVYCEDGNYTSYSFTMPSSDIIVSIYHYEPEHEHSWTWAHNSSQHWQKCSCGAIQNEESHDNYLRETDHQHGTCVTPETTSYKCTKCGWTTTVTGDKDPTEHTGNTYEEIKNYHFWESEPSNKGTKIIYCKDCGKQIGKEWFYSHTPDLTGRWHHSDKWGTHWKTCQVSGCYEALLEKEHYSEEGWKPNDDEFEGTHVKYCICGYQMDSGYHNDAPYKFIPEDNNCDYHEISCGLCGQRMGKDSHHDENEDGRCDQCSFQIGHQYENNTFIDSQHHGAVCKRCNTVLPQSEQSHSLTNPEANKYVCEICNWEYYEN